MKRTRPPPTRGWWSRRGRPRPLQAARRSTWAQPRISQVITTIVEASVIRFRIPLKGNAQGCATAAGFVLRTHATGLVDVLLAADWAPRRPNGRTSENATARLRVRAHHGWHDATVAHRGGGRACRDSAGRGRGGDRPHVPLLVAQAAGLHDFRADGGSECAGSAAGLARWAG